MSKTEWLTVKEFAKRSGYSVVGVRGFVNSGRVKSKIAKHEGRSKTVIDWDHADESLKRKLDNVSCIIKTCRKRKKPRGKGYCAYHYKLQRKFGEIPKRNRNSAASYLVKGKVAYIDVYDCDNQFVTKIKVDADQLHRLTKSKITYIPDRGDFWIRNKSVQRTIMNAGPGEYVVVKSDDLTDLRKKNLLKTKKRTHCFRENAAIRSDNRSGVKGVSWNTRQSCYKAELTVDGKRYRDYKRYTSVSAAAKARKELEDRYWT